MLSLISPSSHDTSAMQSEAQDSVLLDPRHRFPLDSEKRRTELVYAACVFAAGVLLLFTAF